MRELLKPKSQAAAKAAAAAAKAASGEGGGLPAAQSAHEQFRALPRVRWAAVVWHAVLLRRRFGGCRFLLLAVN